MKFELEDLVVVAHPATPWEHYKDRLLNKVGFIVDLRFAQSDAPQYLVKIVMKQRNEYWWLGGASLRMFSEDFKTDFSFFFDSKRDSKLKTLYVKEEKSV